MLKSVPKNKLLDVIKSKFSIVAAIEGDSLLDKVMLAEKNGADMVELRLDSVNPKKSEELIANLKEIKSKTKLSVIATIRCPIEQEACQVLFQWSDEDRLRLFSKIIPHTDIVDVEIGSSSIVNSVVEQAHKNDKLALLSYHNFVNTPLENELLAFAQKAVDLGGDIIKIAVMAKSKDDVIRLLNFCHSWKKTPIVAISLGSIGMVSRVVGSLFGSCFSYGFIEGKPLSPGQLSVEELIEKIRLLDSEYNEQYITSHKILENV